MPTWDPRANDLFLKALELHSAHERHKFLDKECAGDATLRAEVEALLEASARAGRFLEAPIPGPALPHTVDEPITERPGTNVGPYKLLEQIGEGGFGIVFLADQHEPVRRKVALKILKPGMDSRQIIARFEAERQALAIMDHPHIAKVFDGGISPSGRPFFVMELVKGIPITTCCDQHYLAPRQRLELFVSVCQAVQHAHQKGIIHRDLKPSNVLVASHDGAPVVKVIDFGVAKAVGQELTDKTLFTGFAQMIGTPLYMSPEQAGQSSLDIDTRSDIYSLGVLLYELLTGTTPFDHERFKKAAYDEIRRIIREEEPPKPSSRLSASKDSLPSISAQRHTEPAKLTKLVRGDLDWIVMKCLEKDRNRRYETANGLAMDIQRYLVDEPVLARPPSAGYRLQKFVRRNKGPVLAASVLAGALFAGIVGTSWGLLRAEEAWKAESERAEGERQAKDRESAQRKLAEENATRALAAASAEKRAKEEIEAVLSFVENKVFAAGRPKDVEGGLGYDVKLADAVKAALPFVEKRFKDQPLLEARLRMTIATSIWFLGDPKTAGEVVARAYALYSQHLGPDHAHTLTSMNNLANYYHDAGRTLEALKLREENLRLRKARFGIDHLETIKSMNNLAVSYEDIGRSEDALKLRKELVQLLRATLGPNHPDTLSALNNMAACYDDVGRHQEALELKEETLELRRANLGPDHPDTLASMNNLARTYLGMGRLQEAIKLDERALELKRTKLGPNHPDTLISMNNLAQSYYRAGRADEALKLDKETLQLRESILGPDHPETLASMNNLALMYIDRRQWAEALDILKDTLTLRHRRVATNPGNGREESFLAWTFGQIGEAKQANQDYAGALGSYASSVEIYDRLDKAGALRHPFFREKMGFYRQRLVFCQKAERATRDLDWALKQPTEETQGLLDVRVRGLLRQGQLRAAVATAAKMKGLAGENGQWLYTAAYLYALCAIVAKQAGTPITDADSPEKLADEAMALLKKAVDRGYKDIAHLQRDADLDLLRERDDFKSLLAELESKTPEKRP